MQADPKDAQSHRRHSQSGRPGLGQKGGQNRRAGGGGNTRRRAGQVPAGAGAGKGPDIYVYAHDRIGEWIGSGLLHAVTPNRALFDDIDPIGWRGFASGGRLWGYPLAIDAVTLVYNKALVREPPPDFDAVFTLDRALQTR
ncbi:MAG: extracellular solute-binding protein, partial [Rhodobacteraceae bacterium]|nr:extracellular solute-binding protein [Paracoccaceae bacterium]